MINMGKKLRVLQTSQDDLREALMPVVSDVVKEQFARSKELDKNEERVQKILKRDSIAAEVNKSKEHNHDNDCVNCHSAVTKLDDTMTYCKDCGSTTIVKGAEYLICEDCGGFVPVSFVGTNKPCPRCGGTKVRKP